MKDWEKTLIAPDSPMLEAMRIIDASSLQIALVVNEQSILVGVVTDGDIRRSLLRGMSLDQPTHLIMNRNYISARVHHTYDEIMSLMKSKELRHIPILDEGGRVVGLKVLDELFQVQTRENWVVIMAGGIGSRLQPLTEAMPKPLLKIGDKPLIETIIENFVTSGFQKFYVAVNYKADMIERFLGNGTRWDAEVRYLRENSAMGTAGALGLLPETPEHPLIVINGDVLTKINMLHLLDFHRRHNAKATMCIQDYYFQVPYGVVQTQQYRLSGICEKPEHRFYVNAGVYVLEPDVLELVPHNSPFNMTSLFERLIELKYETVVFPVREYWIDVGRIDDFEKANGDYSEIFG